MNTIPAKPHFRICFLKELPWHWWNVRVMMAGFII